VSDESSAFEPVTFESEGARLVGRLYRPDANGPVPLVVMAHGFSATISMTTDRYAEVLRDAGLAVLLYDHRNFGASGGEPRHQIDAWIQARGYRDAITFACTLPEVDDTRIALWGDSLSAAVALTVAGVDGRVAAVVAQVPATGSQQAPEDPDGQLYAALSDTLLNADLSSLSGRTTGPLPVVSADQLHSPSLLLPIQAYRWFIEYGGRFGTGWENRASWHEPDAPAPFHAGLAAPYIRCPVLFQLSPLDEMASANPTVARQVYEAAAGPKQLQEIDGGHFGLLHHPSRWFDNAAATQRDFLADALYLHHPCPRGPSP
jgi:uncharacterized protein